MFGWVCLLSSFLLNDWLSSEHSSLTGKSCGFLVLGIPVQCTLAISFLKLCNNTWGFSQHNTHFSDLQVLVETEQGGVLAVFFNSLLEAQNRFLFGLLCQL